MALGPGVSTGAFAWDGQSLRRVGRDRISGRLVAPFALEVPVDEAFHVLQPTEGDVHPDAGIFVAWLRSVRPEEPEA